MDMSESRTIKNALVVKPADVADLTREATVALRMVAEKLGDSVPPALFRKLSPSADNDNIGGWCDDSCYTTKGEVTLSTSLIEPHTATVRGVASIYLHELTHRALERARGAHVQPFHDRSFLVVYLTLIRRVDPSLESLVSRYDFGDVPIDEIGDAWAAADHIASELQSAKCWNDLGDVAKLVLDRLSAWDAARQAEFEAYESLIQELASARTSIRNASLAAAVAVAGMFISIVVMWH